MVGGGDGVGSAAGSPGALGSDRAAGMGGAGLCEGVVGVGAGSVGVGVGLGGVGTGFGPVGVGCGEVGADTGAGPTVLDASAAVPTCRRELDR